MADKRELGNATRTDIRIILNDIQYIKDDVKEIKTSIQSNYVTKDQFDPVRRLVYGLVTVTLSSVVVAILALVLKG